MKNSNAGNDVEFAGANMPVVANGGNMPVVANGANMPTINIIPGNTLTFSQGITGPVIITNGHGITLNLQGALAPCTITSFDDHLDVHALGAVPNADNIADL